MCQRGEALAGLPPAHAVMPGFMPGIPLHLALQRDRDRDGRDKPGHDGEEEANQ